MRDRPEPRTRQRLATQLLADLANQRPRRILARLHLATGELPQPTEVLVRRSARDQQAARVILN